MSETYEEAFDELQKRTGGPEGATPLEWCIVEMHKSHNPVRAERAAEEYRTLLSRLNMAVDGSILNYNERVKVEAEVVYLKEYIGTLERKLGIRSI